MVGERGKETAQARAEEEKYKAQQAESALKASTDEMQQQETMIAAEAEMDADKAQKKDDKRRADLAKFNYMKRKGTREGFSPLFRSTLLELNDSDTVMGIKRRTQIAKRNLAADREDTDTEIDLKRIKKQA